MKCSDRYPIGSMWKTNTGVKAIVIEPGVLWCRPDGENSGYFNFNQETGIGDEHSLASPWEFIIPEKEEPEKEPTKTTPKTYKSDYHIALECAGAVVKEFKEFGEYRGDWWAFILYDGRTGFAWGDFGTCSSCDAFIKEIGDIYLFSIQRKRKKILKEFGKRYAETMLSKKQAMRFLSERSSYDVDADEIIAWIQSKGG